MRIGWAICGVGLVWAVAARAEDMTTLAGQTYSNVVIQRYDRQGFYVRYDGGTNLVPYRDVRAELRGHYKALSLVPITPAVLLEVESPAGSNDLATLAGQIYRNVVLKRVDENSILIAHDEGMATVSFAAIPQALHEKYRTGTPVDPDPEPGAGDLVTAYGQIFRNVEIVREEPDGLTFRHAGGMTKVGFPALTEEVRAKYNYDPIAGWKYARDRVAQKALAEQEAAAAAAEPQSVGPALVEVKDLDTEALPDDAFRVSFTLSNVTDQPQSVAATVRDAKRLALISRTMDVPARGGTKLLQIDVPGVKPAGLLIVCGTYRTNVVLSW